MNRIVRIEARPDLPASGVYAQDDFRPLAITADYDVLTSRSGPLAALAPPARAGVYRMWLAGPIEAGKSWHVPVLLAHLAVALGAELSASPAAADVVLWSTGAVDLDLRIVAHDYRLAAKVRHSAAILKEAAACGARIVVLVPACEDAAPARELLRAEGVGGRIEVVDGVAAARAILEDTLRPAAATMRSPHRRDWIAAASITALAAVAVALGATLGRDALPVLGLPTNGADRGIARDEGGHAGATASPAVPAGSAPQNGGASAGGASGMASGSEAAAVAVPLQLVELRDPRGLICISVLRGELAPRRIEVTMDGPDQFRDSPGLNLCGLEWTLTPEAVAAGIPGFDIDLMAGRLGARMVKTPAGAAAYTRITVAFERDFGSTGDLEKVINYRANLKLYGAPPRGQVQEFRHTLR